MERSHRAQLQRRFGRHLRRARIACLDIRDDYEFMDGGWCVCSKHGRVRI
jgi:predicted protein tyrosine phosphatase